MSEHRHSNSKCYRRTQDDKFKSRDRHHKEISKHNQIESKTPPLVARRSSIEELMKQRETLKEKLKRFSKHSDSNLDNKYKCNKVEKSNKKSKSEYDTNNTHQRKRRNNEHDETNFVKKNRINKESSPERNGDYGQSESEDEEHIIEKRRQQRKRLLEQFNVSNDTHFTKDESNKETHNKNVPSCIDNVSPRKPISTRIHAIKKTTDMFSDKDDFMLTNQPEHVTQDNSEKNAQLADNWDDSDGYYNVRVGDIINNNKYTIKSILGQGVFANVVRAQDNSQANSDVAIKIVRNNDLMYKTGLKEIEFLKELVQADPENKYHCIKLHTHFMHKGHLCLVLDSMYMDMRNVIKKYGKHGLNLKALTSYSRQLLVALRLLRKIGIVHADIKPDNILVNEKKNVLKLCDFGSATKVDDNEPTPYLVSRFYRAPEIILGIPFKHSVDVWSTACTIYEMATGKIMFTGSSNNKMLKCFMDLKGKFPVKLIRKGKFKDQHFNYNHNFLLHKKDEFTGREKVIEICNVYVKRDLQKELKRNKNLCATEEKKILQLKDILDRMLTIDSSQRLSVTDCLRHPFIQEELLK